MADAADPSTFGPLRWTVTLDSQNLTKATFSSQITNAPHANTLAALIPVNAAPGTYTASVSVTSMITGTTSPPLVLGIQILAPSFFSTAVNPLGLTEYNGGGQPVVDDGTHITANDPVPQPDFPYVPLSSGTSATSRSRANRVTIAASSDHFDYMNPPQGLPLGAPKSNALCAAVFHIGNSANDPASPTAQGYYGVVAYCTQGMIDLKSDVFTFQTVATGIDTNSHIATSPQVQASYDLLGTYTAKNGNSYDVIRTQNVNIVPISGHAEIEAIYGQLRNPLASDSTVVSGSGAPDGLFVVNNKGTVYPRVAANYGGRVDSNGDVPFPFYFGLTVNGTTMYNKCLSSSIKLSGCYYDQLPTLGDNLAKAGFPRPGPNLNTNPPTLLYNAHHIQPLNWGGSNAALNGVWLVPADHQNFTTWWNNSRFSL